MDLTLVLARFWGFVLVITAVALLLNKNLLKEILRDKDKEEFLLLSGFIALLVGSIHVAAYNYIELSARGLITLFGWMTLIKGGVRLVAPDFSRNSIKVVGTNKLAYYSLLTLFLLIGAYFLYLGFLI